MTRTTSLSLPIRKRALGRTKHIETLGGLSGTTGGEDEYLYSQEEVDEKLWVLAGQEFGGKKANGVFFVKGAKRGTKLKSFRKWNCAFYNCCGCSREVQVVYWKAENRWHIEIASKTSHVHGKSTGGAMKQALVACLDSPSKFHKPPKSLIGEATIKTRKAYSDTT